MNHIAYIAQMSNYFLLSRKDAAILWKLNKIQPGNKDEDTLWLVRLCYKFDKELLAFSACASTPFTPTSLAHEEMRWWAIA